MKIYQNKSDLWKRKIYGSAEIKHELLKTEHNNNFTLLLNLSIETIYKKRYISQSLRGCFRDERYRVLYLIWSQRENFGIPSGFTNSNVKGLRRR